MLWPILSIAVSLAALLVAAFFYRWVKALPVEGGRLHQAGRLIQDGAFTFLRREYRILAGFCLGVALLIFLVFPVPLWQGGSLMPVSYTHLYTIFSALSLPAGRSSMSNGRI